MTETDQITIQSAYWDFVCQVRDRTGHSLADINHAVTAAINDTNRFIGNMAHAGE